MLIRGFVIAGATARLAIHQAILADPNVERGLAQAAEFVAFAIVFRHLALSTTVFSAAASVRRSVGHSINLAPSCQAENIPLVTQAFTASIFIAYFCLANEN
jgi:hypothetical protein